jgi:hypothetical protein
MVGMPIKVKSVAERQKDTLYVLDTSLLYDRLNTLYTAYGLGSVVEMFNGWLGTLDDGNIYHADLVMDSKSAREAEDHYAFHKPGEDTDCPWCEDEYQEKLDWEKEHGKT